ncbi:MAG: CDC27 family protein [Armatimonadetes bacterium]|nr:CDC27 family protein [Armatimonadota bacterium]
MRRMLGVYVGLMLAGAGIGAAEAARWLRTLSMPGSPWAEVFGFIRQSLWFPALLIVVGTTVAAYSAAILIRPACPGSILLRSAVAAAIALAACRAAVGISAPFSFAPTVYLPTFTLALAVSAGLLFYIAFPPTRRDVRACAVRGALIAAGWAVFVIGLRVASVGTERFSFGGFGVFAALESPAELRIFPSLVRDLVGGAVGGAFIGAAAARIVLARRMIYGAVWGAAAGSYVSAILFAAHSVTATAIMKSAYSEQIAFWYSVILGLTIGAAVATGTGIALGKFSGRTNKVAAGAIAFLLAAAAVYVTDARAGSDLYLAALDKRPYKTRVYIHFHADGGWSRNIENHADGDKILLCERLLRQYPRSIYAPEAAYLKAKSEFASWRFDKASETLEKLRTTHRASRGTSTLLLAHSYLAMGRFDVVASDFGAEDWSFTHWRSKDGAQMVGHAYESVGRPADALGLYTHYIENLTGSRRGLWISPAMQYAENRASRVMPSTRRPVRRATVFGHVVAESAPLQKVHIALVQPHVDASSSENSTEFTGAITVPLWFGHSATTGPDGSFVVEEVPYGNYEVVVGFDASDIPAGMVISSPVPALKVDRPKVGIPNIGFVSSIKPLSPLDGVSADLSPVLVWREHPGAAYYSVSVISQSEAGLSGFGGFGPRQGYTCWTMPRIRGTSVKVSAEGFSTVGPTTDESRAESLLRNRRYMWMVFAYDEEGNVISSSEHYRLDREPVFITLSGRTKGR